jgi:RNA polymerase sigma-70 factor (ECF subfamily)
MLPTHTTSEARRIPSYVKFDAPIGADITEFDEAKCIRLARENDVEAFGLLIGRHYAACLKRALSLMRNPTDAEDEVQNACWNAFRRLDQYRGEGSFAAWLARIVENQCLMRLREQRQARFLYLDQLTDTNTKAELVGQAANPEDDLGDQQIEQLLNREISHMPPLLRTVMLLSDIEKLPMPDVARRLGLSISAAKSRLGRARVELRSRLRKHLGARGCSTLTRRARYARVAYSHVDG